MKKISVVFMGTPQFSIGVLDALYNNNSVEIKAVVTGIDKKVGRGHNLTPTHVADYASSKGIMLLKTSHINSEKEFLERLGKVDIFVVIAFSQFLSNEIINLPEIACFNIHTSLLPKYRGAAPIQYALLNGDKETGVSIQRMVKKMDAGDIAFERKVSISDDDTSATLFEKLAKESAHAMNDFINVLINDEVIYKEQDENQVSFAPIIKKEDGQINFENESAVKIINKIRAYTPWPGTYTYINNMRVKVHQASIDLAQLKPGHIDTSMGGLLVGTANGTLRLNKVQLDGKKPVEDFQFINGHKNKFSTFEITRTKS